MPNAEKDAGRTWRYSTWGGSKATVVAATVEFTPTHVVWRDSEGSVVLAERPENVNELSLHSRCATCDRARGNLDRHGVHFLTAYVAGV